jgi:ATP-dependent protease ClpP protease subunit
MIVTIVGEIDRATAAQAISAIQADPYDDLFIVVDSVGGDTASALRIASAIHDHPGRTVSRVNRSAHSAAIAIVAAARIRIASARATFAMHETSSTAGAGFTARGFRTRAMQLDRIDAEFRNRIASYTGIEVRELTALEQSGATLTGRQALGLGLITTLAGAPALTALAADDRIARLVNSARPPLQFDLAAFRKIAAMGLANRPLGISLVGLQAMVEARRR